MQLAAARGEEVRDVEIDIVFPDGAIVNLFGYAAPLLDEHGRAAAPSAPSSTSPSRRTPRSGSCRRNASRPSAR